MWSFAVTAGTPNLYKLCGKNPDHWPTHCPWHFEGWRRRTNGTNKLDGDASTAGAASLMDMGLWTRKRVDYDTCFDGMRDKEISYNRTCGTLGICPFLKKKCESDCGMDTERDKCLWNCMNDRGCADSLDCSDYNYGINGNDDKIKCGNKKRGGAECLEKCAGKQWDYCKNSDGKLWVVIECMEHRGVGDWVLKNKINR